MTALAFIPARGGSERVPRKNLRQVGGLTLVARAIAAAQEAGLHPWVSSEDDDILAHAASLGATLRIRPIGLARSTTLTEPVIQDWWFHLPASERPVAVVMLQPTSPLRSGRQVREALELLTETRADSVVSVTVSHAPYFRGTLAPIATGGLRWTPARLWSARLRTQDLPMMGVENGAIYAWTRSHWTRTGRRDGGVCVGYPMDADSGIDVDTEDDLRRAEALLKAGLGG